MSLPAIAFFGATGDVAGYCLAAALQAGCQCIALARTPSKLTASLEAQGISLQAMNNLKIIAGDARDITAVSQVLQINNTVVDIVVTSLGSVPEFRMSLTSPMVIKDPTLCGDGARILVDALRSLNPSKKPLLLAVSTTGIPPADKPRDVPLVYVPLYHWLLHSPHKDKATMEAVIREANAMPLESRPISDFVIVKPTLLTDGPCMSTEKVKAGNEDTPALGYFIKRSEVGLWMFENLIKQSPKADDLGKGICLTA